MNFFAEQDRARRASRRGVLWFGLGVLVIFVAVDVLVAVIAGWTLHRPLLPPLAHGAIFAVVLTTVLVGVIRRKVELGGGGDAVAQMVGGRRIDVATGDLLERRLLNVVEEMAIASGISIPRVYLLDNEEGINAFAAGYSPNEAVVAVTRGTLQQLNREQLQGVIGHEFSHILNGDMALNIRLLSWISGLLGLFILGRFALRVAVEADDLRASAPLFLLGLGLCLLGFVGMLYGQVMQAAVSRQREFLADASAVQFTRNLEGIGGALRRIAGYRPQTLLFHPNGETLSYLCFGASVRKSLSGLFATHPPLEDRIAKIYGRRMPAILEAPSAEQPAAPEPWAGQAMGFAPATPTSAPAETAHPWLAAVGTVGPDQVEAARGFLDGLDPSLAAAIRDPQTAQDLAACCLMLVEPAQRQRQLNLLKADLPEARWQSLEALRGAVAALPDSRRLEVLELALPALAVLDDFQLQLFLGRMRRLALVDEELCLQELVLLKLLEYRLSYRYTQLRNKPPLALALAKLAESSALLLSALAHGSGDRAADAFLKGVPWLEGRCRNLAPEPLSGLDTGRIEAALDQLLRLAPLDKPLLLNGAVAVVTYDGCCSDYELLLLRGLCAALDVPVPAEAVSLESVSRSS